MPSIRLLTPADDARVKAFLTERISNSFILLANATKAGLEDRGERYQGTYVGAFEDGDLVGLVAHYWNGNLLFQAPTVAAELAAAALEKSGRDLKGLVGPWRQICDARAYLGVQERPTTYDHKEILFELPLRKLQIPEMLLRGDAACRRSTPADFDALVEFQLQFDRSSFEPPYTSDRINVARERIARNTDDALLFALQHKGQIVAMCGFHGKANSAVQIGGVFIPPELRSRGFGRSVVAGALQIAHGEGAQQAFLFTSEDNVQAQRAYIALGFTPIGDYGIVHFQ